MADAPTIDLKAFTARLDQVAGSLTGTDADADRSFGDVDGLLLLSGKQDEDNPYRKTSSFQTWLLGYEFPSMLMVLLKDRLICVGSAQKIRILSPVVAAVEKGGQLKVELLTHAKDEAANKANFQAVLDAIKGLNLGCVPKDSSKEAAAGKFADEWRSAVAGAGADAFTATTDISSALAAHLSVKSEVEIALQQTSARAASVLMVKFADDMQKVVETQGRTTHDKLSEGLESELEKPILWRQFKASPGAGGSFERALLEPAYTPIIQSGGAYDVKPTASSDEARLKPGVVIASIGVRYRSYCGNVARTFFVDPDKTQEANYTFLLALQQHVLGLMKDGAVIRDVYNSALEYVRTEKPELEPHFPKMIGFATGIEFRESAYLLGPKIARTLRKDMVFSLHLSLHDIDDPKDAKKKYSLLLVDTVQIGSDGAKVLSDATKKTSDIAFYFESTAPKKAKDAKPNGKANGAPAVEGGRGQRSTVVKAKLRGEGKATDTGAAARRQAHQKELMERRQAEGLEKYAPGGEGAGKGKATKEKTWKRFESYARETLLPEAVKDGKIVVDNRRNTVLLPINGFAVPFHISTLKSVIKQEEGEHTSLRFMFTTPGQIAGKKEDTIFEDPSASFIRTLTYRSLDSYRFAELHKEITELKKAANKRESDKVMMADVVEQDNLVEDRNRRPARLRDVWMRPPFEGKRSTGDVEIHANGIRWASAARSDHKVDVLFSNIKHLFFQPCDNELLVIIHVTLKSPIMVGKKKVKELQFFREASEAAFDETGNKKRRRQADEDEIELEQQERKLRRELNREFKAYAEKISEASKGRFDVDIPFPELGFNGVPGKAGVLIAPSTDCLVHLSEFPPFVLTVADVEICHLERVQFGLKNFDVVFVLHDFTKAPLHINTVPMSQLDNVKDWLDGVDLPYTEGPVNLNWGQIMKTVNDDVYEFFKEGGWSFLQSTTAGSDGESSEEEEEAFKPDSSDLAPEESESDAYSEADSNSDEGEVGGDDDISDIAASDDGSDPGSSDDGRKKKKASGGKKR